MLRKTNFTLIELLVVIAIITILLSILLPSLKSCLEHSKRTVCRYNLRQMYLGIFQHYEDNNGKLYFARGKDGSFNTGDCKYQYQNPPLGIGMTAWIYLDRRKYLDKSLHACPSARYDLVYYGGMYNGIHYGYRYNSYRTITFGGDYGNYADEIDGTFTYEERLANVDRLVSRCLEKKKRLMRGLIMDFGGTPNVGSYSVTEKLAFKMWNHRTGANAISHDGVGVWFNMPPPGSHAGSTWFYKSMDSHIIKAR